jgi:hypothetical protein
MNTVVNDETITGRKRGSDGPFQPTYNPYFSVCFFSRISVFLSHKSAGTVFQLVFSA